MLHLSILTKGKVFISLWWVRGAWGGWHFLWLHFKYLYDPPCATAVQKWSIKRNPRTFVTPPPKKSLSKLLESNILLYGFAYELRDNTFLKWNCRKIKSLIRWLLTTMLGINVWFIQWLWECSHFVNVKLFFT